jgi:hypothetical protein
MENIFEEIWLFLYFLQELIDVINGKFLRLTTTLIDFMAYELNAMKSAYCCVYQITWPIKVSSTEMNEMVKRYTQ